VVSSAAVVLFPGDKAVGLVAAAHGLAAVLYAILAAVTVATASPATVSSDAARDASSPRRLFKAAIVATVVWAVVGLAVLARPSAATSAAYAAADFARYGLWFGFLVSVLPPLQRRALTVVGGLVLAVNAALAMAVALDSRAAAWSGHATLLSLALPVFGLVLLEQLVRAVSADQRWHVKPLAIGLGLVFTFDLYLHSHPLVLGKLDPDALAVRAAVHGLAVPLLYVAAKRQADWARPLRVSRRAVFFTTTLVLVGVYLFVIAAVGLYLRHVDDQWGKALALLVLAAALGALAWLVASPSLRAKLRVAIGKHLFSYRFDYRREWMGLTESLASGRSPESVADAVVRGLATMVDSPGGAVWTHVGGEALGVVATWNATQSTHTVPLSSAFAQHLRTREWIFDLDDCRANPTNADAALVPAWLLQDPRAWLVVPLLSGDWLAGFVVLGHPHAALDVNWETRDLLRAAGRQAAAFLALGQASEALADARKFEAFNRMSAFVVHDMKNVVAQLSLMMQNAARLRHNPDFQADMIATVENSLEKMRNMLTQLREGQTPVGVLGAVALEPMARRLAAKAIDRGQRLRLTFDGPIIVRAHEARLERVLGHLVDNALDACDGAAEVDLYARVQADQAVVEVRDHGRGMSATFVKTELFKPFRTTKKAGMGIGAFESRQYVQELGGSIEVQSAPGQGTTMTLRLPLAQQSSALVAESRT
jgi:putative PEP-CTERM system histidine kinase